MRQQKLSVILRAVITACVFCGLVPGLRAGANDTRPRVLKNSLAAQYQELAREKSVFITPDVAFEQVGWYLADALESVERQSLAPQLAQGLTAAANDTARAAQAEENPAAKSLYAANLGYLLTAARLLLPANDPRLNAMLDRHAAFLTADDNKKINNEIALVLAADGLQKSPLLGYTEDYTQYVPRGRYTRSEVLTRYFRAALWLGRMGFYLQPNQAAGLDEAGANRLAAQGVALLATNLKAWENYERSLAQLFGNGDEMTVRQAQALAQKALGKPLGRARMSDLQAAAPRLRQAFRRAGHAPRLLSTIAEESAPPPQAIRLVAQRFTPDSYVFQHLTFAQVKDFTGAGTPFTLSQTAQGRKIRGVPRGLDLLFALGSRYAGKLLQADGDTQYKGYAEQSAKLRQELPTLLKNRNAVALYLSAIALNDYHEDFSKQEETTNRRLINTNLGAYTLLRHELAAYAKQSYTNIGRGLGPPPHQIPPVTIVDAAPLVFDNLHQAALLIAAQPVGAGLQQRGWQLAQGLALLAREARLTRPVVPAVAAEIWRQLDAWAEQQTLVEVVTDVHTDLNSGQVLQLGVGSPQILEVNFHGQKGVAAVFTSYEFRQPLAQRLDDTTWRKLLKEPPEQHKLRPFGL